MADLLATVAQVKNRLQNAAAGVTFSATDTTTITEIITEVSDWIEGYTHRKFAPDNAATYTFDTQIGYVLRIPYGIRTVTTLSVNNSAHQPDSGGSYTVVPASDFLLRPRVQDGQIGDPFWEIRISRGALSGTIGYFGTIENGAKIVGNFGYAATPPAIEAVAIEASVAAFQARKAGVSSAMGIDDTIVAVPNSKDWMQTLDRYRYPVIA